MSLLLVVLPSETQSKIAATYCLWSVITACTGMDRVCFLLHSYIYIMNTYRLYLKEELELEFRAASGPQNRDGAGGKGAASD